MPRGVYRRKRVPQLQTFSVEDVLHIDELRHLHEEVVSWRDSLEGTSLQNSNRYQLLGEAASALSGAIDELEGPIDELRHLVGELNFGDMKFEMLKVKGHQSRAERLDGALSLMAEAARTLKDNAETLSKFDEHLDEEQLERLIELCDELEEKAESIQGYIEFPGDV